MIFAWATYIRLQVAFSNHKMKGTIASMKNSPIIKVKDFEFEFDGEILVPVLDEANILVPTDEYNQLPDTIEIFGVKFDRISDRYCPRLVTGNDWRGMHADFLDVCYPEKRDALNEAGKLNDYLDEVEGRARELFEQLQAEAFMQLLLNGHQDRVHLYRSVVDAMRQVTSTVEDSIIFQTVSEP